jgi:hypothetical protein
MTWSYPEVWGVKYTKLIQRLSLSGFLYQNRTTTQPGCSLYLKLFTKGRAKKSHAVELV